MYSVLNPRTRNYDYYESGETEPWHSPAPPRAHAASDLGATPDDAAWPLPAGAKKVGSGFEARGRVATTSRSGGFSSLGAVEPAVVAGAAVLAMVAGLALLTKASR